MSMKPIDLTAALDAARWLEPPKRDGPCPQGHDPKYSYVSGRANPVWRCVLCRKQATRRRARELATWWRLTPAQAESLQAIGRLPTTGDRLREAVRAWLRIEQID